jgi:hypothetical protein
MPAVRTMIVKTSGVRSLSGTEVVQKRKRVAAKTRGGAPVVPVANEQDAVDMSMCEYPVHPPTQSP